MTSSLPPRTHAEVIEAYPHLRQSRLAELDSCPLMTRFGLEGYDYSNPAQARGILFHRAAAEVMKTLWRTGNTSMPVAESLEVLYEVCAQRDIAPEDVVWVPMRERRLLRMAMIGLVYDWGRRELRSFNLKRMMGVENRLFAMVEYSDRETGGTIERAITGQPDVLLADPPNGAVVLDWKTSPSPPPKHPHDTDEASPHGDDATGNVSYTGYFQQRVYALLVMGRYPSVEQVTLREFYVLCNESRNATVFRSDLEHIERELAVLAELFDRAVGEGSKSKLWSPQAGLHCAYCPKPRSCPIEDEVRIADGGVVSEAEAMRVAEVWVKTGRVRKVAADAAKAWHEATGHPIPMKGDRKRVELRWGANSTGTGRCFDLHPVEPQDPPDGRLTEAFEEAAERKRAVA